MSDEEHPEASPAETEPSRTSTDPPRVDTSAPKPIGPTVGQEREPILDVVRGFALLGILLVNVLLMRGSDGWVLLAGGLPERSDGLDRIVNGAVSWLTAGKFVSCFAILFGLGAGLIVERALAARRAPRPLLAKRYTGLIAFGLAHMVLLFPGDILFVYGFSGLVLLAFVKVSAKAALRWSIGLLVLFAAFSMLTAGGSAAEQDATTDDPAAEAFEAFVTDRSDQAVQAFTDGAYLDVIVANGWQSVFIQIGQLMALPWLLGLFLLGFAVARAGIVTHLTQHRPLLRRVAIIGLGVGLPLNVLLAPIDTAPLVMGGAGQVVGPQTLVALTFVRQIGAPLLAIGYLAALALLCLRVGPSRRLAAVGRMALSAYLLQSLFALIVFAGFRLYNQLSSAASMLVVLAIWAALLAICPWWLQRFRFGPAEWLWRSLTYGTPQPMRRATDRRGT